MILGPFLVGGGIWYSSRFKCLYIPSTRERVFQMKKFSKVFTSVLVLSIIINSQLAHASDSQVGTEQEVIVVYKNEEGKEKVLDEVVDVKHEFETIPAVSATVTNADLHELASDPNIAYIERNITFRITGGDFKVTAVQRSKPNGTSKLFNQRKCGMKAIREQALK